MPDSDQKEQTLTGLKGWLETFRAHTIESDQARALKAELIRVETELFKKNQNHAQICLDENGKDFEVRTRERQQH